MYISNIILLGFGKKKEKEGKILSIYQPQFGIIWVTETSLGLCAMSKADSSTAWLLSCQ